MLKKTFANYNDQYLAVIEIRNTARQDMSSAQLMLEDKHDH